MKKDQLKQLIREILKYSIKEWSPQINSHDITSKYWWMDSKYKFYSLSFEEHRYWAEDYLKKLGYTINENSNVYKMMYNLGFVRVIKENFPTGNVLFYTYSIDKPLNSKQLKELKDFAIEQECDYITDGTRGIEKELKQEEKSLYIDENMSYEDLLKLTTPERKEKENTVRSRSIPVSIEEGQEQWNFRYKSNPSVTKNPFQGSITFLKGEVEQGDDAMKLDCKVDCSCPDFKYRFAYLDAEQGASEIGPDSLNKSINKKPNPAFSSKAGLCKHLASLRRYLETKITSSPKKSNLFETIGEIAHQGSFNISYYD